ncbi:hypothetical protein Tco_0002675 [Tanacetum coccineum]
MEDGIFFNQSKYIKEMLNKFGLKDSTPTKTPMSTKIKLSKDDEADFVDSSKYRALVPLKCPVTSVSTVPNSHISEPTMLNFLIERSENLRIGYEEGVMDSEWRCKVRTLVASGSTDDICRFFIQYDDARDILDGSLGLVGGNEES